MQNQNLFKVLEENYLLLLIILLGAVLRLYDLSGESIWLDEAYTINISQYNPLGIIKEILSDNENHPPLYYSFMHYWIKLFGDSAFSVRFPSVIFGVLSIIAIYKMALILFNKYSALISALILSTSVLSIEFSQNARSYSLLALLSLLSFYYFTQLLQQKSFRTNALYTISTILLMYTHHYAIFILLSQNIFFFSVYIFKDNREFSDLIRWLLFQIIFFVSYLPILYLVSQAGALSEGYWMSTPNLNAIPGVILSYSGSWALFIMFSILSILSVLNLIYAFPNKDLKGYVQGFFVKSGQSAFPYIQKIYLLLLWISVPVIIPFLISIMVTPVFQPRFAIGGAAAFFILVAKGVESLGNKKIIVLLAGVILLLSLLNVRDYYAEVHKHQWREAISYLESEAKPDGLIFVSPEYEVKSGRYHLIRDDLEMTKLSEKYLSELNQENYDFWVILSWHGEVGKESLTYELLKNYNVKSRKDFHKLKIYRYQN